MWAAAPRESRSHGEAPSEADVCLRAYQSAREDDPRGLARTLPHRGQQPLADPLQRVCPLEAVREAPEFPLGSEEQRGLVVVDGQRGLRVRPRTAGQEDERVS